MGLYMQAFDIDVDGRLSEICISVWTVCKTNIIQFSRFQYWKSFQGNKPLAKKKKKKELFLFPGEVEYLQISFIALKLDFFVIYISGSQMIQSEYIAGKSMEMITSFLWAEGENCHF